MYFNARYYDPDLGTFISPDTLVPDPTHVFDYNRYMAFRGNPLKYTDPSGHCAVNADGSPDRENDKQCWEYADEYYKSWHADPHYFSNGWDDMTPDEWYQHIATQEWATAQHLEDRLVYFWSPRYTQWGVHHQLYNPAPNWHQPLPQQMIEICEQGDCVATALSTTSVAASSLSFGATAVSVTCATVGLVPCAMAAHKSAEALGKVSMAADGLGVAWTAYQATQGNATEADLTMSATTFTVGSARKGNPVVGFLSTLVQVWWDNQ